MANIIQEIRDEIVSLAENNTYQSPLEIYGIAMRQAVRPYCYYNNKYNYATPIGTDSIRTNNSYVSISGWRPSTYQLKKDIHDKEWEEISSLFDVQTGGGGINQAAISNIAKQP